MVYNRSFVLEIYKKGESNIIKVNYKHIGRRIRQERMRNKLSQEELSEMINSSPQYISLIETARKKPSLEMLIRIANALQVSIDQLIAENLTTNQIRYDAELSRILKGCSNYERRVILDIATAIRYSLKDNNWIINTDKS